MEIEGSVPLTGRRRFRDLRDLVPTFRHTCLPCSDRGDRTGDMCAGLGCWSSGLGWPAHELDCITRGQRDTHHFAGQIQLWEAQDILLPRANDSSIPELRWTLATHLAILFRMVILAIPASIVAAILGMGGIGSAVIGARKLSVDLA
ncbi:hypothetical protein AG1IA_08590 [Rhizoctonia solani AG-1 IA]|uniref:Uncharacterized protein n=1 Tax=Thanatephorus cucumeris (strain AG1-IA) TaxID=983506 RepID=L8WHH5_THACA|nr:hypothetical protein AG1IA_08590 [Rhizoctonia solani AG-1 IA]